MPVANVIPAIRCTPLSVRNDVGSPGLSVALATLDVGLAEDSSLPHPEIAIAATAAAAQIHVRFIPTS